MCSQSVDAFENAYENHGYNKKVARVRKPCIGLKMTLRCSAVCYLNFCLLQDARAMFSSTLFNSCLNSHYTL